MSRQLKLLLPILFVLVASCAGLSSPAPGSSTLDGRFFELNVTHRLDAEGQLLLQDSWTESDFSEVDGGQRYLVSFSDDEQTFAMQELSGEVTLTGHLDLAGALPADVDASGSSSYTIDEGSFAGGRLVIWRAGEGLRAEVTIFGSGLPVLFSERGDLIEI